MVKEVVEEAAKQFAGGSAVGVAGRLSRYVKLLFAVQAVAAFATWLSSRHHWSYVIPGTVGVIVLLIAALLRRNQIADKLSLPIRFRYLHGTGWHAIHSHTEAGPERTRLTAARELVTMRWRLIQDRFILF